jgi:hypothetical protein
VHLRLSILARLPPLSVIVLKSYNKVVEDEVLGSMPKWQYAGSMFARAGEIEN